MLKLCYLGGRYSGRYSVVTRSNEVVYLGTTQVTICPRYSVITQVTICPRYSVTTQVTTSLLEPKTAQYNESLIFEPGMIYESDI